MSIVSSIHSLEECSTHIFIHKCEITFGALFIIFVVRLTIRLKIFKSTILFITFY